MGSGTPGRINKNDAHQILKTKQAVHMISFYKMKTNKNLPALQCRMKNFSDFVFGLLPQVSHT